MEMTILILTLFYPNSISNILTIPNTIPILHCNDVGSLNTTIPIIATATRFTIVNIQIDFDKDSYFNDTAQNAAPIE